MVRLIGLAAALLIAVSPALAAGDRHFLLAGGLAGVVCASGLLRASLRLSLAGCLIALPVLTVALFARATLGALLDAFSLGIGALIVLDLTAFQAQSTDVEIGPTVVARHLRALVVSVAAATVIACLLVALAFVLCFPIDARLRPLVAVAGAILCLAAVLRALVTGARSAAVKLGGDKRGPP